jgi:hypothetical protein
MQPTLKSRLVRLTFVKRSLGERVLNISDSEFAIFASNSAIFLTIARREEENFVEIIL